MPITSTIQQNQFSFTGETPGNSAIGDAAAAGTSAAIARADHKHGREASGTPGASAVGDTASAGTATTVALSDHRHSREAFGTPVALSGTAANGSATTVARSDHQHGGTVAFPLGTASAPSIAPSGDTNTGLWSPAADTLALSTGGSERVRVDSSGNVGIGTTSPSYKLDIAGNLRVTQSADMAGTGDLYFTIASSTATGNVVIDSASGHNSTMYIKHAGANKWIIINNSSNSRYQILDADYNDGVYISQNTTSWTANSDIRLKDVQGTITNALEKVQQLTGVKFTWKRDTDNPDAKVRVGLIAQDVQAVLPEAVDDESPDLIADEETGKISGGLGVRYTELVPLLVNAIKELAMQHQLLQTRVAALEVQP